MPAVDPSSKSASPLSHFKLNHSFEALGESFYSEVFPQGLNKPQLVDISPEAAALIGIDHTQLLSNDSLRQEFIQLASGNRLLANHKPLAMVYSGHQFGIYVPRLGDGRAILLGQLATDKGNWDLQLKGAGITPYSRSGDGKAVLRSTIREHLCSEAMHGLGIPSTRSLALTTSDDPVYRESVEPAAMLIRLARTHIRFGSFEYFHYTGQHTELRQLADHVIDQHHPDLKDSGTRYAEFFRRTVIATAQMIAQWQAVGFAHGVMNTDNMSILGDTLDYGPFGFLDAYNPQHICNHSDHQGRYAFSRQPAIGLWNCNALAHALSSLISSPLLTSALQSYEPAFLDTYLSKMSLKLGLLQEHSDDGKLIDDLLSLLATEKVDYTLFFRTLCDFGTDNAHTTQHLLKLFQSSESAKSWLDIYKRRLQMETLTPEQRQQAMRSHNPKYVLRNYLAEQAIRKAEDQQDFSEVQQLRQLLSAPYDEQPELTHYCALPPRWSEQLSVSCSS